MLCLNDFGSSQVTSQNPESTYEALKTYGTDLTSMAREGKLDPVIGRDDEIRRVTWKKMENMKQIFVQDCSQGSSRSATLHRKCLTVCVSHLALR